MTAKPARFPFSAPLFEGGPLGVLVVEGCCVVRTLVVICVVTQNGHFGSVIPGTPAHIWA